MFTWACGAHPPAGDKRTVSLTPVSCKAPGVDIFGQLIVEGKTGAVTRGVSKDESLQVTHSESHWCTDRTFLDLVSFVEEKVDSAGGDHYIIVLDLYSVHRSELVLQATRTLHPRCHLAFISAHTTPYAQPLDIAYRQPIKKLGK